MKALVLFAHGARDPAWALPFERLQILTSAQLPGVDVHLAFLELMTPTLPTLLPALAAGGCSEVTVVPVFLGQGGHVRRDLPALIADLQSRYPQMAIRIAPAIGEDEGVLAAIARYCIAVAGEGGA
jgi:sirohydrochlorin cobaltochelatase